MNEPITMRVEKASVVVVGDSITDEQIAKAVADYMSEHPVNGVTEEELAAAVEEYFAEHPVEGGTVSDEQIAQAVSDYMADHPIEVPEPDLTGVVKSVNGKTPDENGNVEITVSGSDSSQNGSFRTDETLNLEDGVLSVNTTDLVEQDNTLPITSAGVYATVGNIEALLKTI